MHIFYSSISFIVSVKISIFPLNMRDMIIYVAQWWEKYLWKRNPLKDTCSWRDELIVLWILNRQAKIFLHKSSFVNNRRARTCLFMDMLSSNWLWIAYCWLWVDYSVLSRFVSFGIVKILVQLKDKCLFSRPMKIYTIVREVKKQNNFIFCSLVT